MLWMIKNYFSRFIIELAPRLNEIGANFISRCYSIPDGSPNWSLCYNNRHVIEKLQIYIVFMAYDQHGGSSEK